MLSSHAAFQGAQQSGANGRSAQGWLLLARSLWHGPNKDGRQNILLPVALVHASAAFLFEV